MLTPPRVPHVGIGSVYIEEVWLAQVQYTLNDSVHALSGALHILDGERDLFAPPIPTEKFILKMADGRQYPFVPASGNPVVGAYTFSTPPLAM